ncbi:MAG: immune inhibitor A [Anaerolineae bacterium]
MEEQRTEISRNWAIAIVSLLIALCCCCLAFATTVGIVWFVTSERGGLAPEPVWPEMQTPLFELEATPAVVETPTPRSIGPLPTPYPTPELSPLERELSSVVIPTRDLRDLALRLRPDVTEIPVVVNPTPPTYKVGDRRTFWVSNTDTDEHFQIEAELRHVTPHLYMWVEVGRDVDQRALERSADRFEREIYPTNREFFGSEWTPGVDNDPHLTILHAGGLGEHIAGYYSSADEFSRLAQPYSNEMEMFYINIDNTLPGTEFYDSVLAHEFQHMIHWYNDRNEETWVNEGFSELAAVLNGFSEGRADALYSMLPDTQLNTWSDDPGANGPHYGAAFLFMHYFLDRFGEEMTKAVVAEPANGIAGFDAALEKAGRPERFINIFADWLIANFINDPDILDGRYGYSSYPPDTVAIDQRHRRFPVERESQVQQFAADYIVLQGRGDAIVRFEGAAETRLANTKAHSGRYMWWANRADDSDARLTREFDLTGVDRATLKMWMWYDIEENYDYLYVTVSTDGGKKWTTLPGQFTTDENPTGNSLGHGYTGKSGDGDAPTWVEERIDLTPYAGKKILIRFEYVTDDAVNYPGFFLDDVSIPEIGYESDFESDDGGWISEGWIRTDNVLPQRWLVQIVEADSREGIVVRRLDVGADGRGQAVISGLGRNGKTAALVISAITPVTTEPAPYRYSIELR